MSQSLKRQQSGFTIIELMIATSVFATMLLLVSMVMISIGNLFYKGINQSRVQDTVRAVTEELSHNIQETSLPVTSHLPLTRGGVTVDTYCINGIAYSYVIGQRIGSGTVKHVLWRNTLASASTCFPADLSNPNPDVGNGGSSGAELIPANSRLRDFKITPSVAGSPYSIVVGMVYGDDDLLCSPSVAGSCSVTIRMPLLTDYQNGDLKCKGKVGDSFCSVSSLTTIVVQRIN